MPNVLKNEKGVSLVITFFIMMILLAVVLGISVILYSELKVVRNMGNSVVAFYAADTGVEQALYFDRHGTTPGFCNICASAVCQADPVLPCSTLPQEICKTSGSDCAVSTCTSCKISYKSNFPGNTKNYLVTINTSSDDQKLYATIDSNGDYSQTTRQIETKVQITK